MSPSPFSDHPHTKTTNGTYNPHHPPAPASLKINKDSHFIKKSPPTSSSSSCSSLINAATGARPQRHPVIIYTHSPKIIHTHPRDFMALVQKLTGLSRDDDQTPLSKFDQTNNNNKDNSPNNNNDDNEEDKNNKMLNVANDDNESTSVITDENGGGSSSIGDGQVNSCFIAPPPPPIFDPPNQSCYNNIPFFSPNSTDFLCSTTPQPIFYNYTDSIFFMPNNNTTRSTLSSSPLEAMKEFAEY